MTRGHTTKGFTIVELLIVIIVIAILAAIVIVAYTGIQDKARFAQKRSDIENLQKLIEVYYAQNGSYPDTSLNWKYQAEVGDAFIPGLVPQFAGSLPRITDGPTSSVHNNTYVYKSNGTDYKLIRLYQPNVPAGEWSQVPASMHDANPAYTDRWGVWSANGASL